MAGLCAALVAAALLAGRMHPSLRTRHAPAEQDLPPQLPDDPYRDGLCRTKLIRAELSIKPAETVADIGAGGGYYTFKIARLVGERGRVIATDIDPKATVFLRRYSREHGYRNVIVKQVDRSSDIGIDSRVDKALLVNLFSFHEVPATRRYFRKLSGILASGGKVYYFSDDCGPAEGGQAWAGRVLCEQEMRDAARGIFALEKSVPVKELCRDSEEPVFLVLRKP